MWVSKVHVWHFGKDHPAMVILALESIGQNLDGYSCTFCQGETGHYRGDIAGSSYVVCSQCGEASKLVTNE